MTKLSAIFTLLFIALPHSNGSNVTLDPELTTTVCFQSTSNCINHIPVTAKDSISMVFRKVAKAFGWQDSYIIYCYGNNRCLFLTLDQTDSFLNELPKLTHGDLPLIVSLSCPGHYYKERMFTQPARSAKNRSTS